MGRKEAQKGRKKEACVWGRWRRPAWRRGAVRADRAISDPSVRWGWTEGETRGGGPLAAVIAARAATRAGELGQTRRNARASRKRTGAGRTEGGAQARSARPLYRPGAEAGLRRGRVGEGGAERYVAAAPGFLEGRGVGGPEREPRVPRAFEFAAVWGGEPGGDCGGVFAERVFVADRDQRGGRIVDAAQRATEGAWRRSSRANCLGRAGGC